MQKAIQLWEELPTQGNEKYFKILILFPAFIEVCVVVDAGGIEAATITREVFYPFVYSLIVPLIILAFFFFFSFILANIYNKF